MYVHTNLYEHTIISTITIQVATYIQTCWAFCSFKHQHSYVCTQLCIYVASYIQIQDVHYCDRNTIILIYRTYIENCSRWKNFVVFMDRLVMQNFSSEITCAVGLAMHDYCPTVKVFQRITNSSATAKLFHLK